MTIARLAHLEASAEGGLATASGRRAGGREEMLEMRRASIPRSKPQGCEGAVYPVSQVQRGQAGAQDGAATARFWRYVEKGSGCWKWTGSKRNGYGQITVGPRRTMSAHRFSYELHVSPVPQGLQVDHLCRNPECANPSHLEVVTPRENTLRSPITIASRKVAQSHCIHGHELSGLNLRLRPGREAPRRQCRQCDRDYQRRRRLLKRSVKSVLTGARQ